MLEYTSVLSKPLGISGALRSFSCFAEKRLNIKFKSLGCHLNSTLKHHEWTHFSPSGPSGHSSVTKHRSKQLVTHHKRWRGRSSGLHDSCHSTCVHHNHYFSTSLHIYWSIQLLDSHLRRNTGSSIRFRETCLPLYHLHTGSFRGFHLIGLFYGFHLLLLCVKFIIEMLGDVL